MEEDQELKHVCKLCNEGFHSGRSLGGHMRSHVIMNSTDTYEKLSTTNFSSIDNGGTSFEVGTYGLRENPKKNCRFVDLSEDKTLYQDKFCKDCGKGFQSWKGLFGHMKCHTERKKSSTSFDEENSWTSANEKLIMDSQSDNEVTPNRRRRSRRTRYIAAATTASSLSFANASSSVSEVEQEQEEVAMCLMMLSRDVGKWGGLNSVAESSDSDSVFLEAPWIGKIKDKSKICNGGVVKFNKLKDCKLESANWNSENFQFEGKQFEFHTSGVSRNGSKMKRFEVPLNGILGNSKIKKVVGDGLRVHETSQADLGKEFIKEARIDQVQLGSNKNNSRKRVFSSNHPDSKMGSSKKVSSQASDSATCKSICHEGSKFECTACNRIFHSYQALGGHRASHKKMKGCFASRVESNENSIETEFSPDPTTHSKLIKSHNNGKHPISHDVASDYPEKPVLNRSKKTKGHECPICFKVFSSGQALGGHKRSHLVGGSEAKTNQTNVATQIPVPEIRDLLDLNLPAPIEEDQSNTHIGFKPWWAGSSHEQDPLTGLISN